MLVGYNVKIANSDIHYLIANAHFCELIVKKPVV